MILELLKKLETLRPYMVEEVHPANRSRWNNMVDDLFAEVDRLQSLDVDLSKYGNAVEIAKNSWPSVNTSYSKNTKALSTKHSKEFTKILEDKFGEEYTTADYKNLYELYTKQGAILTNLYADWGRSIMKAKTREKELKDCLGELLDAYQGEMSPALIDKISGFLF